MGRKTVCENCPKFFAQGLSPHVGIIFIVVKGLMMSLMSDYNITIHTSFPIYIYIKKMGACEKVKSEMVVSNPWVWKPMIFSHGIWKSERKKGINYLINGCHVCLNQHVPSWRALIKSKKRKYLGEKFNNIWRSGWIKIEYHSKREELQNQF